MQDMYGYIYLMKNYHSVQCLAAKEAQKNTESLKKFDFYSCAIRANKMKNLYFWINYTCLMLVTLVTNSNAWGLNKTRLWLKLTVFYV